MTCDECGRTYDPLRSTASSPAYWCSAGCESHADLACQFATAVAARRASEDRRVRWLRVYALVALALSVGVGDFLVRAIRERDTSSIAVLAIIEAASLLLLFDQTKTMAEVARAQRHRQRTEYAAWRDEDGRT